MDTMLKRLRDRTGESSYAVAARVTADGKAKLSQSHYIRVESGETDASPELAAALASHFMVPLEVLFNPSRYAVADKAA